MTKLILSTGCVLMIMFASFSIGGAIIIHGMLTSDKASSSIRDFIPSRLNKPVGDIGKKAVEDNLKYGPVNLEATKEAKDGILSRIRSRMNRQSNFQPITTVQNCQPTSNSYATYSPAQLVSQTTACVPCEQVQVVSIRPVQSKTVTRPNAIQEQPAINPFYLDQVETFFRNRHCPDCITVGKSPSIEVKTGAFICSHCRKPKFGDDWHTDWRDDGTPITYLCEGCYQSMTVEQRIQTYKAYAARQIASGKELVYQEVQ